VVSITVGSGNKNVGGALSIVAGSSTQTGTTGQGGSFTLTAGRGAAATGGAITFIAGEGKATTSGSIVVKTVNAGTNGISGGLVFSTGTTTKDDSVRALPRHLGR
jgi:hypothetical protein